MTENEISNKIIGLAIDVHRSLGPGLLESAYKECLYYRLRKEGFLLTNFNVSLLKDGIRRVVNRI